LKQKLLNLISANKSAIQPRRTNFYKAKTNAIGNHARDFLEKSKRNGMGGSMGIGLEKLFSLFSGFLSVFAIFLN